MHKLLIYHIPLTLMICMLSLNVYSRILHHIKYKRMYYTYFKP